MGNEFKIDETSVARLARILEADEDVVSIVKAAEIEPESFRDFLIESGESLELAGLQMLYESTRTRRNLVDDLFYGTAALLNEERSLLAEAPCWEGAVIVVWPVGQSGGVSPPMEQAALRALPGPPVLRFTVGGIGGSAIGAATLARYVADYYDEPVGAIVTGSEVVELLPLYPADWMQLWMSWWNPNFKHTNLFSGLKSRHEATLARFRRQNAQVPRTSLAKLPSWVTDMADVATLISILLDEEQRVEMLLGHSKGVLTLSFALEGLVTIGEVSAIDRVRNTQLVTVGATAQFPPKFKHVYQFLGELDWFGAMNSRHEIAFDTLPGTGHHLNPSMPMHIILGDVLEQVEQRRRTEPDYP